MGLNPGEDYFLEPETIIQDETAIQQETVIKYEPFVNEEVEMLVHQDDVIQVTEYDQISYTLDNADVCEPGEFVYVTEELEQVELCTDMLINHSHDLEEDGISFEKELQIIQNDVFDLPEASWENITDEVDVEAPIEEEEIVSSSTSLEHIDLRCDEVMPNVLLKSERQPKQKNDNVSPDTRCKELATGYMRLIIKNDEISMSSSKMPPKISTKGYNVKSSYTGKKKMKKEDCDVSNKKHTIDLFSPIKWRRCQSPEEHDSKQKRVSMNNAERLRRNVIAESFRDLGQLIPEKYLGSDDRSDKRDTQN